MNALAKTYMQFRGECFHGTVQQNLLKHFYMMWNVVKLLQAVKLCLQFQL